MDCEQTSTEREQRLDKVVTGYLQAVEAGRTPDRQELLRVHADLEPDLTEFFADQDQVCQLAEPLRWVARAARLETPLPAETASPGGQGTGPSACRPDTLPRPFGSYELLEIIGEGGMGVIYKARQGHANRLVALKTIRDGRPITPAEVQRFRNEAELVAGLDHSHIVPLYEAGEHEGQLYYSMKLIEGGSLARAVEGGPWPVASRDTQRQAARLLATVARAVHHAHQRGVLHRDLKPANILLDADGQPHVTDFGLARRVEADSSLTQSGALVGTPSYVAPEQTLGRHGVITTATDVYGLGTILYAMVTGQPPFRGETVLDTMRQVQEQEPKPPRASNPRVDRDLETICLKCLQKEPHRRYRSAEAFAEELEHWLAGEPIQARPIGRLARLWRWSRRKPALAAAAGVLIAAGVALVVSWVSAWLGWIEAERQRGRAENSARQAEDNVHLALLAVNEMLSRVGEERLSNVPQMESVRRELLAEALRLIQELARQNPGDPQIRVEMARAYGRMGSIQHQLGQHEDAEKSHRRAMALLEVLTADFPAEIAYSSDLAGAQSHLAESLLTTGQRQEAESLHRRSLARWQELAAQVPEEPRFSAWWAESTFSLGELLRSQSNFSEGETCFRQALDIQGRLLSRYPTEPNYRHSRAKTLTDLGLLLKDSHHRTKEAEAVLREAIAAEEKLNTEFPHEPSYRRDLAKLCHNLGTILDETERAFDACPLYRRAIELQGTLAKDFPATPEYRRDLAKHWSALANAQADVKDFKAAQAAYQQAIGLQEQLTATFTAVPAYRQELALTYANLGETLCEARRQPEALEPLQRALAINEGLVKDFPNLPDYRHILGQTFATLAELRFDLQKPELARALAEKAVAAGTAAVRAQPLHAGYARQLSSNCQLLARARLRLGQYAGAVQAAQQAVRTTPHAQEACYRAAGIVAACIPLVERDKKLTPKGQQSLLKSYADQALASLAEAIRLGFQDLNALKGDPVFNPLREREPFKRLVRELEGKQR